MGIPMDQRAKWESTSTSDRIIAGSTLTMAAFTIFLTVLACLQWREIHTGSADTHELAIAAKTQADNTITLANAAKKQADAAASQVDKLQAQIDKQDQIFKQAQAQTKASDSLVRESRRGADSAKEEVDIARSAQRPWMVFQITAAEPVPGSKFGVTATAQNSGKSPAYVLSSQLIVRRTSLSPETFANGQAPSFNPIAMTGSQTVVTPGNAYSSESEQDDKISTAQSEIEAAGLEKLYIFAYLTYQDLGTSKTYRSKSCVFWDLQKKWQSCHGFDSAN